MEQGLALLLNAYTRDPSSSHVMELGVAYLWAGKYQEAAKHFEHATQTHRHTSAAFYGMAGAAYWCLDRPHAGAAVSLVL